MCARERRKRLAKPGDGMKIMLVCMSGITTNVLSNKLQAYGTKKGREDSFLACKTGEAEEFLPEMDLILIAPQARYAADGIRRKAEEQGIPAKDVEEEAFVLGRVEEIYGQIDRFRPAQETGMTKEAAGEKGRRERKLRPWDIFAICGDAAVSCFPLLLLAGGSWLVSRLTESETANVLWQVSGGIFNLYFLFAVGYQYGTRLQRPRFQGAILAMGSPLVLLPLTGVETHGAGTLRISTGNIPLDYFGFRYTPVMLAFALIAILALDLLYRRSTKGHDITFNARTMANMALQGGLVFAVFLLLRFLLQILS